MNTLPKSASLDTLDLPAGEHLVKFNVGEDTISFEVESSKPGNGKMGFPRKPTGFVAKWGGSVRKEEDSQDGRLDHINKKHLR
jgi:hypothetical protein